MGGSKTYESSPFADVSFVSRNCLLIKPGDREVVINSGRVFKLVFF